MKIASRGDLLLAAPAFELLRRSRPSAHLTLLVGASCVDVACHLPYFDAVRVLDDQALLAGGIAARARAAGALFRELRSPSGRAIARGSGCEWYTELLLFHRDWRYALLARLAGIPVRRGLRDGRGGGFLSHAYHPASREHDTRQYIGLVTAPPGRSRGEPGIRATPALAGVWQFEPAECERALAEAARHGFQADGSGCVALGFGGGRNVKTQTLLKCWPLEGYRELAVRLVRRGLQVVWLGDAADAERLGVPPAGTSLAGKLSVAETAVVLRSCAATVANDSFLLHLSEAVGTPTLGLFGPTDPLQYGPQGPRSAALWFGGSLPCSPCSRRGSIPPCAYEHRCMRGLPVEAVLERVEALLVSAGGTLGAPHGAAHAG